MQTFNSYSDAATFAKQSAKEQNAVVRVKRQGDIFVIHAAQHSGLNVAKEGSSQKITKPLIFFKTGTFFFNSEKGVQIKEAISSSLSPFEKQVIDANEYLPV